VPHLLASAASDATIIVPVWTGIALVMTALGLVSGWVYSAVARARTDGERTAELKHIGGSLDGMRKLLAAMEAKGDAREARLLQLEARVSAAEVAGARVADLEDRAHRHRADLTSLVLAVQLLAQGETSAVLSMLDGVTGGPHTPRPRQS
jgi:hypothetical protein